MADAWLVEWTENGKPMEAVYLRDRKWAADQLAVTFHGQVSELCRETKNKTSPPLCTINTGIC